MQERAAGPTPLGPALLKGCSAKEFAENLVNNCVVEVNNTA